MTNLNLTVRTAADRIRSLCIKEQYYTNGTIQEYDEMLTYVYEHRDLTEESLDWIAKNILEHSCYFDETISNIKFKILNDACYIFNN